jgi:glycosyltransferase involved in cell wall biosynthesis/peptidoglycan/xylan/chitin deacetylase (PgdA/CDA1 family)
VATDIKISVVIPTYNRRGALSRTLDSIFSQKFGLNEFEVIVVVDGSTDGTAEFLHELKPPCAFRVIEQPNRGQAAARNAGWKTALGEVILFLDDDILCNPLLLSQHFNAHQNATSVVVFGPVPVAPESPKTLTTNLFQDYADNLLLRLSTQDRPKSPDETMVCSNTSIARATLEASGGFDERFFRSLEDIELGLRLLESGVSFQYEPTAVAFHLQVKPARTIVEDQVWSGRSQILLCRAHPAYRRHSMLPFRDDSIFKRFMGEVLIRSPLSLAPVFRPLFEIADRASWIPFFRVAAIRLHNIRRRIQFLRSAVREAGSLDIFNREFGKRLPVLLYHYVGPEPGSLPAHTTISAERFEKHVQWLSRQGYTGIAPSDWLRWCEKGAELPRKPVLLTFDDAYSDLAKYVLPVLRHYGFRAGVFAVTKRLGGTNTWDETGHPLMNEEQIRYWAAQGIEFGAHSRTHPNLTSLAGAALAEEIDGSKNDLESVVGSPVLSFAYPYGSHSQIVRGRVRDLFKMAFTVEEGLNDLGTDQFLLRRMSVDGQTSLVELGLRVRYGRNPFRHMRRRFHEECTEERPRYVEGRKSDGACPPRSQHVS